MSCCNGYKSPNPTYHTNINEFTPVTAAKLAQEKGHLVADQQIIKNRISLCQSCPYFNVNSKLCNRCGCLVIAKVGKAYDSCPIQRW